MIDGAWRPGDVWGGFNSGMFSLAPFTNMTPVEVAQATRVRDALAGGMLLPFDGPIVRQDGTTVTPAHNAAITTHSIQPVQPSYPH